MLGWSALYRNLKQVSESNLPNPLIYSGKVTYEEVMSEGFWNNFWALASVNIGTTIKCPSALDFSGTLVVSEFVQPNVDIVVLMLDPIQLKAFFSSIYFP